MEVTIREESIEKLDGYTKVPMQFTAEFQYRVETVNNGLGGLLLIQESVTPPREIDVTADQNQELERCRKRWDTSLWGVLSAFAGEERVGGVVIAYKTEDVYNLEGRKDVAALYDFRVTPEYRRQGIGKQLFQAAIAWAHTRGCRIFRLETQNRNVPLCRLAAGQGCRLGTINQFAYPDTPGLVMLVWYMYIG
jgi:GNAT superfamily N-acetyltransferase